MSINKACQLIGFTKQAFFEAEKNQARKLEEEAIITAFILEKVNKIRTDMPRIGGRKLLYLIKPDAEKAKIKFGRNKFFEILKQNNLLVKRRKKYVITTDKCLWRKQFDNLIIDLIPSRPEQIWVADITYFRTTDGFVYGHLITDGYSKKIMGFAVTDNMKATSTLLALKMALKNRIYDEKLIHHSDRGFQYCSKCYTDLLKKNKILISMTQNGSPYENPVAERINGILKDEFLLGETLEDLNFVKEKMKNEVEIYNSKRPHTSNHMLTPNKMHLQRNLEIITWKNEDFI